MALSSRGVLAAVAATAVAASVAVALAVGADRAARLAGSPPARVAPSEDAVPAPEFAGVAEWLNTPPLTMRGLRGKVVLVDFWTYSCINCRRTFGFLRALQRTYEPHGLVIVGVHTPEF